MSDFSMPQLPDMSGFWPVLGSLAKGVFPGMTGPQSGAIALGLLFLLLVGIYLAREGAKLVGVILLAMAALDVLFVARAFSVF